MVTTNKCTGPASNSTDPDDKCTFIYNFFYKNLHFSLNFIYYIIILIQKNSYFLYLSGFGVGVACWSAIGGGFGAERVVRAEGIGADAG